MRYPQQLGKSSKVFGSLPRNSPQSHQQSAPEPSGTLSTISAPRPSRTSSSHLHRNPPQPHHAAICTTTSLTICPRTLPNLARYLHRNRPEADQLSATESSSRICPGTLRNFISPQEPHQPSAPEPSGTLRGRGTVPSGTSAAICPGTLRNLIGHLHQNPPEPHHPSAPEPSQTSLAICTRTSEFHRPTPEPSPEPGVAAAPDRTRAILG